MSYVLPAIFLTSAWPMYLAWRANQRTSLRDTLLWALAAWAAWASVMFMEALEEAPAAGLRYLALCLTSAAGMAVLGARRPGMTAWNFVVIGLLSVELMPLFESVLQMGHMPDRPAAWISLIGVLVLAVLNYLSTRIALAAILLGVGAAIGLWHTGGHALIAAVPWACWIVPHSDDPWIDFRDRFGAMWGLRVREMFNAAARNAQLPIRLTWWGLAGSEASDDQRRQADRVLRGLLQRFLGP